MSVRSTIAFDHIDVRQLHGIYPGFLVDGLCSGINVISGPNASGKTTLTVALLTLLWPASPVTRRATVSGSFACDGAQWLVEYDNDAHRCQRDGIDTSHPALAAANGHERYVLALHDLLSTDNRSFAEAILRESSGGYDISAASATMKYTPKPSARTSLKASLDRTVAQLREARAAQTALQSAERRREVLLRDISRMEAEHRRLVIYERALAVRRARGELAVASRQIETFPSIMAGLSGTELDALRAIRQRQAAAREAIRSEEHALAAALERQRATRLHAALPAGLTGALRQRVDQLHRLSAEMQQATLRLDEAREARATARRAMGPHGDEELLASLDAASFERIATLAREYETAYAQSAALESLAAWVGPLQAPHPDQAAELEVLTDGMRTLNRWLRHAHVGDSARPGAASGGSSLALILTGVAVIVQSLLLAVSAHPAVLILIFSGIWLIILGVRAAQPAAAPLPIQDVATWLRASYSRLPLPQPAMWDEETIERLADELGERRRSAQANLDTHRRWSQSLEKRGHLEQRLTMMQDELAMLLDRFGLPHATDVTTLHVFAGNVVSWQREHGSVAATSAAVATLRATIDSELNGVNAALAPFGYPSSTTLTAVSGIVDDLAARERAWTEAQAIINQSERLLRDQFRPLSARCDEQVSEFFRALDITEDAEHVLHDCLERLPDYKAARRECERATLALEHAETLLGEDHPLAERDDAELESALTASQALKSEIDAVRDEIAAITTRVSDAKQQNDIERLLRDEDEGRAALIDAREQAMATVAGWSIAEHIREETRDNDRPAVFHRARELFARITQGRYRLEMSDGDPPTFRALDSISGAGHALDELSSGTRLQLLLAVRVAFVEHQEHGVMLPLIFDETLGNSDEQRARAIIDATVEIARNGRQVLYLTAQHDEVRKWQSVLSQHPDVPFQFLDLAEIRGLSDWERVPPAATLEWPELRIPEPDGLSRAQYRDLLRVPGIDFRAADIGNVHLWHLIDDPRTLYRLLTLHIETWGQLQTMTEHGGLALLDGHHDLLEQCRARANVIRAALECRRIGHGRHLDRAAIIESGLISDAFVDRVAALAHDYDGDAVAVVEALRAGEARSFRTNVRMSFEQYLEQHAYIASDEPLTYDEARVRVIAAAASDLRDGHVTVTFIVDTLRTLWGQETTTIH